MVRDHGGSSYMRPDGTKCTFGDTLHEIMPTLNSIGYISHCGQRTVLWIATVTMYGLQKLYGVKRECSCNCTSWA